MNNSFWGHWVHRAITLFLTLLCLSTMVRADYAEQSYSAASAPGVSSKSLGFDFLSGTINYSQSDIVGVLPYTRIYQGSVRSSMRFSMNFYDKLIATAGWTDNYDNFLDFQNISANERLYRIRLPGELHATYFVWNSTMNTWKRMYSSSPEEVMVGATGILTKSDLGEYSIIKSAEVLNIKKYGVTYVTTASPYQSGTAKYLRVASVSSPSTGKTLTLSYDAALNMTQVQDNRGSTLTFTRAFKENATATTQTANEKTVITAVTYAGASGTQTASYTYEAAWNKNAVLSDDVVYKLISTTSTVGGTRSFAYEQLMAPWTNLYLRQNGANCFAEPCLSYVKVPVLTQVKNANLDTQSQIIATQNYSYNTATKGFNTATATIRGYAPVNSSTVSDMTVRYDDMQGKVFLDSFKPNGTTTVTASTLVSVAETEVTLANGFTYLDNSQVTLTYTSPTNFAAFTVGNQPIASMVNDSYYSRLVSYTTLGGAKIELSYDDLNRIKQSIETDLVKNTSRTTTYTYGALSNGEANPYKIPTTITKPYQTITNVVNANGQITRQTISSSQTDSFDKVTDYTYYPNGLLNTVTPVRSSTNGTVSTNDTVSYTYDDWGNVATETRYRTNFSTNVQTSLITKHQEYNSAGQPKRTVYPDGRATEYTYNNRLQKEQQRTGIWNGSALTGNILSQTWAYNDLNQVTSACDADSVCTFYHLYDALSRPIIVTKNDGSYTTYSYHPNNTPKSVIQRNAQDVISAQQYYTLDANGRVEQERSGATAGSNTVNKTYDVNGNLSTSTTANGLKDSWTYDALNRVETHTDPAGKITTKNYDLEDNLKTNTDPIGETFQYNYRNGGVKSSDSTNSLINNQYQTDALDNIKSSQTDTRQCAYPLHNEDNLAHVKDCQTDNAPFRRVYELYHYNNLTGLLEDADQHYPNGDANLSGKGSRTTYSYDEHQRLSAKVQYNKKLSPQPLVNGYGYTNGGRLAAIQYPSGRSVTYTYDNAGRVNGVYNNNAALITNISYDGSDRSTGWSWGWWQGSQVQQEYVYDANTHQLTQVNHLNKNSGKPPLLGTCAGYDRDGRVNSLCDSFGQQYQISLDSLGRVTTNKKLSNNQTQGNYTYDDNGNRTVAWSDRPATYYDLYQYSGNKQTGLSRNDAIQPITQIAEGIIATNQLIPVYDATGRRLLDTQANGTVGWYHYNHKNERTYKQVGTEQARQFAYDEAGHLIGEYTLAGAAINEYIWLGDTPIAVIRNGILHYITADALNTPRVITNASNGGVVWAWSYEGVFGEVAPVNYQPTAFEFNLRFAGQYADAHSGLFYNHHRYYSPRLGRYMEPDPIGLEGGLNPYAYAGSNPVMNTDPSGLMVPLTLQEMGMAFVGNGHLNQAITNFERSQFNSQIPTVDMANANLKINGGFGKDVSVNASRLRVEPNGTGNWQLNEATDRYQLSVRVNGWLNESGSWVNEGPFSIPTGDSRAYWVYGQLTLSDNHKLFSDPYNFEYHSLNSESFLDNSKVVARNALTWIGGLYSGTKPNTPGYFHNFYGSPYCPTCPALPSK